MGFAISNLAKNPALIPNMPFDLARDLVPVVRVAEGTYALPVNPAVPAQNVQQLLALMHAAPDRFNASAAGAGSPGHLAVAQLNALAGINVMPMH